MLKISPRVFMNHSVANAVISSFDLKAFNFIFGNFLIADMWKKHRGEVRAYYVRRRDFVSIPGNQKHSKMF